MRKLSLFATLIALLLGTIGVQSANAQWPQTTHRDIRMSVEVGALAFDRPGVESNAPVVSDSVTGRPLFTAEHASDLGTSFGAEININFLGRYDREWELRTILGSWEENATFTGNNLASPFFPVGGTPPTDFDYGYQSDYFSIELMRRRAIAPGLTIMAGPRIVSTRDQIDTEGSLDVLFVPQTQTNQFEATNVLLGLQGGLELNLPVTNSLYVSSYIRAGGYFNPTEFSTSSSNSFTGATVATRRTASIESFLGEVGARVNFDLVPNCVSSYVGYEATWIDGIALATANATSTGAGIDTSNTAFFHAVAFGVEIFY